MSKLMRWHLRLAIIKNEMDLLENPETRVIFEEMNAERLNSFRAGHPSAALKQLPKMCVIPLELATVNVHMQYFDALRTLTAGNQDIRIFSKLQV